MQMDACVLPLGTVIRVLSRRGLGSINLGKFVEGKIGTVSMSIPCPNIVCVRFDGGNGIDVVGLEWCLHDVDIEILNDPDGNY